MENNRINPVLRIPEELPQGITARRLERLQAILKRRGLGAMLFERRWLRSDRWVNDLSTFGSDNEGWYLVPADGVAWATNGFVLEESGRTVGREALALYAPDGSLVNWLTDCDLLDMLGDRLVEDGMAPDQELTQVRTGTAKLIRGLGWRDLEDLLGEERRLGVVLPGEMRASLYDYLTEHIPALCLEDVTDDVLSARAVKEPEDLDILQRVARQHELAVSETASALHAGMTEREAANLLRFRAYRNGCGGFNWKTAAQVRLFFTDAADTAERDLLWPGRTLREGDRISLGLQAMGSSGFYGGLTRCFSVGEPAPALREQWEQAVELTDHAAGLLLPGRTLRQVRIEVEEWLDRAGMEKPEGSYIHSVGYAAQEPPETNGAGEDLPLRDGMAFSVAPPLARPGHMPYICGDLYVLENGTVRRLTQAPREAVVL